METETGLKENALAPGSEEETQHRNRLVMQAAINQLRSPISSTPIPQGVDDLSPEVVSTAGGAQDQYEHLRRLDDNLDEGERKDTETKKEKNNTTKRKADLIDDIFTPLEDNELDIEEDKYD